MSNFKFNRVLSNWLFNDIIKFQIERICSMEDLIKDAKRLLLLGDLPAAKKLFKETLSKNRTHSEALHGLGYIAFLKEDYTKAEKHLIQAIQANDKDPELFNSIGILYLNTQSWDKASKAFENAKEIFEQSKSYDEAKYNNILLKLADIYVRQQKFNVAKDILKKIIQKHPEHLNALKLLAQVYIAHLKYYHAINILEKMPLEKSVREALKAEVFLLKQDNRNALKCAQEAVTLDPHNPRYYSILGECYIKTYELEKSIDVFTRGLQLDPNDAKMLSRLLALQVRVCDWEGRREVIHKLQALPPEKTQPFIQPTIAILAGFSNAEVQKVAEARCKTIEDIAKPVYESLNLQIVKKRGKKIKIGYLSSDFYDHATAHLMLDVFALHDRKKFEVFAYSYGKNDRSYLRKKIRNDCDHFIDIGKISDKKAAQQINEDGIDILVDLKGHIVDHRLGILALRPSPIQVHYLGYPGTIGANFIDYLIADRFVVSKTERKFYSESIAFLPITYQANTESKIIHKKPVSKGEYHIPANHFVFCCFNQNDKFDTETVNAWMKILQAVPKSVLWIWGNYMGIKQKLDDYGKKHGVNAERFIVSPTEPHPKHLARMQLADLFLDTFYYNAHTSCSDAIRVGLPILTRPGKTFASRVAASLLKLVKANKLIAKNTEDYIAKAIQFAAEQAELKRIQDKIIQYRDSSQIYNPKLFTKHLDQAFLQMWEIHQSGKPPRDIVIQDKQERRGKRRNDRI
jgi:predicted O-linked N-acetylglucosamine transferase (SPINDLY family)